MAAKVKKPDIYSRLTDPKLYTGAHKARFDSDGKGRGLAGRDMFNEGKVNDLSQLTRGSVGKAPKGIPSRKPVVTSKPHVFGSTSVEVKTRKPAASVSVPKAAPPPAASAEASAEPVAAAAAPAAASPTSAGAGVKKAKKGDIYSRLTDPKLYTGAHKARFDADGHGRGIAGRTDVQVNDLSQLTRPSVRKGAGGASPSKKGTVSGVAPIAVTKFGTQASVARKIHVFQNGDKHHKGVVITMIKGLANMDKLLGEITNKLALTTGAAQRVYRVVGAAESFTQVTSLDAFEDGGLYLACGPEKIDKTKLPSALTTK